MNSTKFVFLSRGIVPPCLKPFMVTGSMSVVERQMLSLDYVMVEKLLITVGLTPTPTLINSILKISRGCIVAVCALIRYLEKGGTLNETTVMKARQDLFDFYDQSVFQPWDKELKDFLMAMAPFEQFTCKMAEMIIGRRGVENLIHKVQRKGGFLELTEKDTYRVTPFVHEFLVNRQKLMCSEDIIINAYHNAGLYYELENDYSNALWYYQKSNDMAKISQLLIRNSQHHPGNGHFYETESYYRMLPREHVLASTELMSGMSMLCSLFCQPEESEQWFGELQKYRNKQPKNSPEYRLATSKLLYLDIALPHRGNRSIASNFAKMGRICASGGKIELPEFSVTSNMPSV